MKNMGKMYNTQQTEIQTGGGLTTNKWQINQPTFFSK